MSGGIYDVDRQRWRSLPPGPPDDGWRGVAGALGSDDAAYVYADGWLLDVATESWVEVPAIDGRYESFPPRARTVVGRDLFVYGGERQNEEGESELINEASLWRAP